MFGSVFEVQGSGFDLNIAAPACKVPPEPEREPRSENEEARTAGAFSRLGSCSGSMFGSVFEVQGSGFDLNIAAPACKIPPEREHERRSEKEEARTAGAF